MNEKKEKRLHNVTIEHVDRMCEEARIGFDELIDRFALPIDLTDYFLNNHRVEIGQSNRITRHLLAVKRKLYIERGLYRIEFRTNGEVSNYVRNLIDTFGLFDIARNVDVSVGDLLEARDNIDKMKEKRLDGLMKAFMNFDVDKIEVTTSDELSEILGWLRKIYFESDDMDNLNKEYARKMKVGTKELDDFVKNGVATRITLKKIATFVDELRNDNGKNDMLGNALIIEN